MSKHDKTYKGTVRWFDAKLGYGFIDCEEFDKQKQIFVHYSRIESNETLKTLSAGQYVTFEVVLGKKGWMAVNVREDKIIPVKVTVIS